MRTGSETTLVFESPQFRAQVKAFAADGVVSAWSFPDAPAACRLACNGSTTYYRASTALGAVAWLDGILERHTGQYHG